MGRSNRKLQNELDNCKWIDKRVHVGEIRTSAFRKFLRINFESRVPKINGIKVYTSLLFSNYH